MNTFWKRFFEKFTKVAIASTLAFALIKYVALKHVYPRAEEFIKAKAPRIKRYLLQFRRFKTPQEREAFRRIQQIEPIAGMPVRAGKCFVAIRLIQTSINHTQRHRSKLQRIIRQAQALPNEPPGPQKHRNESLSELKRVERRLGFQKSVKATMKALCSKEGI